MDRDEVVSWELLKLLAEISHDTGRQVGVIVDRRGKIEEVLIGEARSLPVPDLSDLRAAPTRLSGFRLIHTHLSNEGLTSRDIQELRRRRFDLLASVSVGDDGLPAEAHVANLNPDPKTGDPVLRWKPVPAAELNVRFREFIEALEEELRRKAPQAARVGGENRAILCALRSPGPHFDQDLQETADLAVGDGLQIIETLVQNRPKPDPKFMLGEGKFQELLLRAAELGATTLLFQQNLSPNQMRHLMDATRLKVIDRTQLILDIFAQRAKTHEGKQQVELAQLRYLLPRLREKEMQLSRLVGGIGGRGPGETTLEIHRRRAKDRMNRLEKEIDQVGRRREERRSLRKRSQIPVISIVGYTNAGKSTLLNSLTNADAFVENRPFATLDPFSKRLRFPRERDVILTDTVGFIRDLPKDLLFAFRATLEEIGDADLLLHVVDLSRTDFESQMGVVRKILEGLGFGDLPEILIFNKSDLCDPVIARNIADRHNGVALTALHPDTCRPLLDKIEATLWKRD